MQTEKNEIFETDLTDPEMPDPAYPEEETDEESSEVRDIQENTSPGFQYFMNQVKAESLMTAEEETALSKRIQKGDKRALDEMVRRNMRLCVNIAHHYAGHGVPLEDLVQEGSIGLMHAAEKFRPQKGCRFSTYATWWIRQTIGRAMRDSGRIVRLPDYLQTTISRYNKLQTEAKETLGRRLTDQEAIKALGITPAVYEGIKKWAQPIVSLQKMVGEKNDTELGELIADTESPTVEELCEKSARKDMINHLMDCLTEKERKVLIMRFGLGDAQPMTLEEIGTIIGVTRERVRQIQLKALKKLKAPRNAQMLSEISQIN